MISAGIPILGRLMPPSAVLTGVTLILTPFDETARLSQLDEDFDRRPVVVRAAVHAPIR